MVFHPEAVVNLDTTVEVIEHFHRKLTVSLGLDPSTQVRSKIVTAAMETNLELYLFLNFVPVNLSSCCIQQFVKMVIQTILPAMASNSNSNRVPAVTRKEEEEEEEDKFAALML